ncbi:MULTISPECIES: hypothetical protein [Vibrio]|uniref:hypothetical protein n=1 Tax=Vibrio TaxID=662 RepID=UPI0002DC8399|nr:MULTISPECIES: hypothetical protein [Vibrio]MDE3898654.1 hypothetical protein [Vibrio sp. CC007]
MASIKKVHALLKERHIPSEPMILPALEIGGQAHCFLGNQEASEEVIASFFENTIKRHLFKYEVLITRPHRPKKWVNVMANDHHTAKQKALKYGQPLVARRMVSHASPHEVCNSFVPNRHLWFRNIPDTKKIETLLRAKGIKLDGINVLTAIQIKGVVSYCSCNDEQSIADCVEEMVRDDLCTFEVFIQRPLRPKTWIRICAPNGKRAKQEAKKYGTPLAVRLPLK